MRIRRCAVVYLEPREDAGFALASLLAGQAGIQRRLRWLALAPHLQGEIEIDADERELLGQLSPGAWVEAEPWQVQHGPVLARLLDSGLVTGDDERHAGHRERDEALRAAHWWPPAALAHRLARWQGLDSAAAMDASELSTAADIRRQLGPPPAHTVERAQPSQRLPLPRLPDGEFERLLARRATCRNFDPGRALPYDLFVRVLQRVFAAQAQVRIRDDTIFLKKHTPSGGGLHATEAYLIVRNVEGVAPGLYHYHPTDHALEPMALPAMGLAQFASRALAGQHWFADAHAMAVLTPRYARSFWKYRRHAKAYRALVLDSGHLSQTLYLSATELGLGAFVTSAINEIDIEQAFALDPLVEGPLAICGFGWRSDRMRTSEFDPTEEVWNKKPEQG
ncbi:MULTISPECIES: putative peptide maturation dehydrogenase [Lysobacter]|uniref:putative peptide maturation dehydrogenase n=1 Tax=Lysobacter TaxID=68 RepID=UPI001F1B7054|nr:MULTISPECIES: putative peptide maturation dehydrogenase [Lysobacter]UJB18657.1 putative peptide maturation dehydrogenase [Lysobacter capsici]UJQ27618.1 putative peptide maturation dehydrogenase [Lysobacter gummosus]